MMMPCHLVVSISIWFVIVARRLERIMKEVLDDFGEDPAKLEQLLSGHRIKLAEDLSECP